jgi:hypothetical protein
MKNTAEHVTAPSAEKKLNGHTLAQSHLIGEENGSLLRESIE